MDNLKISELFRTPTLQSQYRKSLLTRSQRSKSTVEGPSVALVSQLAIQQLQDSFRDLKVNQHHLNVNFAISQPKLDLEIVPLKVQFLQRKLSQLENSVGNLKIQKQNEQFLEKGREQIRESYDEIVGINKQLRVQVDQQKSVVIQYNNFKNAMLQILHKHNVDKFYQKSEAQRNQYIDELPDHLDRLLDQKNFIKQFNEIFEQEFTSLQQITDYHVKISDQRRDSSKLRRESDKTVTQDKNYYQQLCITSKQNESLLNENTEKNDILKDLKVQIQSQIKLHENFQKKVAQEKEKEQSYFIIKIQDLEKEVKQLRDRDTEFQHLQAEKDHLIQQYVIAFSENINIVEDVKSQNDIILDHIKNQSLNIDNYMQQQLENQTGSNQNQSYAKKYSEDIKELNLSLQKNFQLTNLQCQTYHDVTQKYLYKIENQISEKELTQNQQTIDNRFNDSYQKQLKELIGENTQLTQQLEQLRLSVLNESKTSDQNQKVVVALREELEKTQNIVDEMITQKQQSIQISTEQKMKETKLMEQINQLVFEQQEAVTTLQLQQQEIEKLRNINKSQQQEHAQTAEQTIIQHEEIQQELQSEVIVLQQKIEELEQFQAQQSFDDKQMQSSQNMVPTSLQTSTLINSQVDNLQHETVELQQKAQSLEQRVDEQLEELLAVKLEKDSYQKQLKELIGENTQLTQQLEQLRLSVLNESKTSDQNQKVVVALREELEKTQNIVDEMITQKQQSIQISTEQKMKETKLMEQINQLVFEQQEAVTTLQLQQQEIEKLRNINKSQQQEHAQTAEQTIIQHEEIQQELQSEVIVLQQKIEELEQFQAQQSFDDKQMQSSQNMVPTSLQTSTLINSQVDNLQHETVELQQKAQSLEQRVDEQLEELLAVKLEKDSYQKQLKELIGENTQLTQQLEQLRLSVLNESKTSDQNQKVVVALREELEKTQNIVDEMITQKQQSIQISTEQKMKETKLMEQINQLVFEQQEAVTTLQLQQQEIEKLRNINKSQQQEHAQTAEQTIIQHEEIQQELQSEVIVLQQKIEELEQFQAQQSFDDKQMQSSQNMVPTSLQTSTLINSQVDNLQHETVELQQKAQSLEQRVDEQLEELLAVKLEKDSYQKQLKELIGENTQLTQQLEQLRLSVLNESKTSDQNQKVVVALREELEKTQNIVDEMITQKQQSIQISTEQKMKETKLMEQINQLVFEQQEAVTTLQLQQQEIEKLRNINKSQQQEHAQTAEQTIIQHEEIQQELQSEVIVLQQKIEELEQFQAQQSFDDKQMQSSQNMVPTSLQTSTLINSQVDNLQHETVELQQKAQSLEQRVDEQLEELLAVKLEKDSYQKQLKELIGENTQLVSQMVSLKDQIFIFNQQEDNSKVELQNYNETISSQLKTMEIENLNLTRQLIKTQASSQINLPNFSTKSVQTQIDITLLDSIQLQNKELAISNRKLVDQVSITEEQLLSFKQKINTIDVQQNQSNSRSIQLNDQINSLQLENAKLREKLEQSLQNPQQNVSKHAQNVLDLENALRNLNKENKQYKKKYQDLEQQLLEKRIEYNANIKQLQKQADSANKDKENALSTLVSVQTDLQDTKQDLLKLKSNFNQDSLHELVKVQENEINLLKQQIFNNNDNNSNSMMFSRTTNSRVSDMDNSIIAPKSVIEDIRSIKLLIFDVFQLSEDQMIKGQLKQACDRLATVIFALTFKQNCDFLDQSEDLAFSRLLIEKQEERQNRIYRGSSQQLDNSQVSLSGFI